MLLFRISVSVSPAEWSSSSCRNILQVSTLIEFFFSCFLKNGWIKTRKKNIFETFEYHNFKFYLLLCYFKLKKIFCPLPEPFWNTSTLILMQIRIFIMRILKTGGIVVVYHAKTLQKNMAGKANDDLPPLPVSPGGAGPCRVVSPARPSSCWSTSSTYFSR